MAEDLNIITMPYPNDWVSSCGVCGASFAIRAVDSPENPSANGSFCFDCQSERKMAPGVLHWRRRRDAYPHDGRWEPSDD